MKYILEDGGKITATNPAEFVTRIRESSLFDSDCTDEQYMKNFAGRYKIYAGIDLNIETPEAFLEGLIASKFILSIEA